MRTVKQSINLDDFDHSQWDGFVYVYPSARVKSHFDTTVRATGRKQKSIRSLAQTIKEGRST